MMTITDLSVGYGAGDVLHSVDITAASGELTVIPGANGSGKSTLFRTVSGLLRPSSGRVEFDGEEITRSRSAAIVRRGLAHCPEGRHLFPRMSVEKNLTLGAYVGRRDRARVRTLLERSYELFPALRDKSHQSAGSLSGGQQQMVAIGRALMSDPKMLIPGRALDGVGAAGHPAGLRRHRRDQPEKASVCSSRSRTPGRP
ncbi:ATP-binding cassette domain-containing protein [Janibacter limosus]|uniref:ATP-binding cassette domain-containing protein n=1 Tax=Janibacter limosus TaxID=53458 RepID=A0AC61U7B6_9MICO|nr:ATP-binding cassette domain-containing protein [Janibacter limosus]UUZ45868.1 ATP-binding cassette domain-containing protein [Janibacter limosus]